MTPTKGKEMFGIPFQIFFTIAALLAGPAFVIAAVDLLRTFPKDNAPTEPLVKPGTRTTFNTFK